LYLKLTKVAAFSSGAISDWAEKHLAPGAAVTDAGCTHQPLVVGNAKPAQLSKFTWISTVLGNLKTSFAGTFHAFKFAKYDDACLAEFAYRFNRRFDLKSLVARLIVDVARCALYRNRAIRQNAEDHR
jgi:hypothetical protein